MISKETQYRIYAGTRKEDYTGWEKVEVDPAESENVDFWSLDLGNGYFLDRVTKNVRRLTGIKRIRFNSIRRDRSVSDPDGSYKDVDLNILFDVDIKVSDDSIKFDGKNNSFILLSREPINWDDFSEGVPKFDDKEMEKNYASFYS